MYLSSLQHYKSSLPIEQALNPIIQLFITPKIKVPLLQQLRLFTGPVVVVVHRLDSWIGPMIPPPTPSPWQLAQYILIV